MSDDHLRIVASAPGKNRLRWTPVPDVTDWETFTAWIVGGTTGGGKNGRPYTPVTLKTAPGRRLNVNLASRHVLTLDADSAGADYLDRLAAAAPFASLSHTTANHTPDAPRWRTLLPLSRAATPAEAKTLATHLVNTVGRERFDVTASTSPAAVAYAPAWDGVEYHKHDGPVLDVDDWLMVAPPMEWAPTDAAGALTVAEFHDEHAVTGLADLPDCPYGRTALHAVAADLGGTDEGRGVHAAIFHAACRGVEMVLAGCWSVRDLDLLQDVALTLRADPRPHEWDEALASALAKGCTPDADCREHGADLFDATPVLRHVRQAAHARLVAPSGLLVVTLMRVLAEVPPGTVLPPVVGDVAALNLGAALVAGSGGGKSATVKLSRSLLGLHGVDQKAIEEGMGSGEGLIDLFLEPELAPNSKGEMKPTGQLVLKRDPRVFLVTDEVEQMGAVGGDRKGSTLNATLRTALTGGGLKTANAKAGGRYRAVEEDAYRLVAVVGIQPEASGVLLAAKEEAVGTPQRFIWASVQDAHRPEVRPEWPGPLDWAPPDRWPGWVEYPDQVRDAVIAARERFLDGLAGPREGHLNLTRLKVAFALAVLHREVAITDRWWRLAGLLVDASVAEQVACRAVLGDVAQKGVSARRVAESRADEAAVEDRLKRAVAAVVVTLRKHPGEQRTWREVKPASRLLVGLDTREIIAALQHEDGVQVETYTAKNKGTAWRLSWDG